MEVESLEDDLTDERIDQLVREAEQRLQDTSEVARTERKASHALPRKPAILGLPVPYVKTTGVVSHADSHRLLEDSSRKLASGIRKIEDPVVAKRKKLEAKNATAGPSWFNLPRTNLTPELKRDLQLLRMRSVLDPKRFYKKENSKAKPPEFSQVGTVIEGPTDFFSGRIAKKDRKRTLAEEILAGERDDGRFKRQYLEVQQKKTSGKRGDYKKRQEQRYGKKLRK